MLIKLLRYTELADQLIIDAFMAESKSLPEAEKLFSHVLNSQHIWVSRIKQRETSVRPFSPRQKEDFRNIHRQNLEELLEIAETADLSAELRYKSSKGEEFADLVSDILLHVINHSTYHRAQIATILRQNDITPPVTDYIVLKREGKV